MTASHIRSGPGLHCERGHQGKSQLCEVTFRSFDIRPDVCRRGIIDFIGREYTMRLSGSLPIKFIERIHDADSGIVDRKLIVAEMRVETCLRLTQVVHRDFPDVYR